MKKDIHPKFYEKSSVSCACGASFFIGSVEKEIKVEICSACHPFYTGNEKVLDTAGRVDKFKQREAQSKKVKSVK